MQDPFFSVIVSSHNSEEYIAECVESVLRQDYPSFEVIVVDDASSDGTRDVLARYREEPRVRTLFMNRPHGGPSLPRNVGLSSARGDAIMVLDDDDLLAPGVFTLLATVLTDAPEVGLVFFNSRMVEFSSGQEIGPCLTGYDGFWRLHRRPVGANAYVVDDPALYRQMVLTNFIKTSGTTLPKQTLDRIGPFDTGITNADDWDMWLRVARRFPFGFIDAPGVIYRRRSGSVSDRGGRLVANRLRVLDKQAEIALSPAERWSVRRMQASNLAALGYAHRLALDLKASRRSYSRSLWLRPSFIALKGWAVSWLGRGILGRRRASDAPAGRLTQ